MMSPKLIENLLLRKAIDFIAGIVSAGTSSKTIDTAWQSSCCIVVLVDGEIMYTGLMTPYGDGQTALYETFKHNPEPVPGFEQWFPEPGAVA